MTSAHIHLLSVHLPVVGVLFACALLILGHLLRRDLLLQVGYGAILASAAFATVAYYSGPAAYQQLEASLASEQVWVERHEQASQFFFITLVLTAIVTLQALLGFVQAEAPPPWLRSVILGLVVMCCYLAVWSAHLGGAIRHEEIRQPEWLLLPHVERSQPAG